MNNKIPYSCLIVLFLMLWLPLGQQDFLIQNWMKLGAFIAPVLLMMFFVSNSSNCQLNIGNFELMSVVMLVLYFIHQCEEHWLDLFGNYFAFYYYFNTLLAGVLGQNISSFEVLTPLSIFIINTSLVWLVGFTAILGANQYIFPSLAMNGIILINAFTHILAAIANQAYNPGLLTSVILFVPFSAFFYRRVLMDNVACRGQVIASLVWAIFAHVLMVGGLVGANWFHVYPESFYFVGLVLYSLAPMFFFRALDINRSDYSN